MPREISDELFGTLLAEGRVEDVTPDDLDDHDEDQSPAASPTSTAPDAHEVASARTALIERAQAAEAEGDFRSAATLKSQAAFSPDSALASPATPVAAEPVPDLGKAISEAEQAGEWRKALSLKTRLLLKGSDA